MDIKQDLQLLEDLEGMERRIKRGWTRGAFAEKHLWHTRYCLTGAMNKQILGVPDPVHAPVVALSDTEDRRKLVLKELGFGWGRSAESWNDTRSSKEVVLHRIRTAMGTVRERIEAEQLRITREQAEAARQAAEREQFAADWLAKERKDESEQPLFVPPDWAEEPEKEPVK